MSLKTKNRIKRLVESLGGTDIDGIFISQPENRRYLSGFEGSDGFLVITAQDSLLATDSRYTIQAQSQAPDFKLFTIGGEMSRWFPELITGLGIERLGFEAEHLTFAQHRRLYDILGKSGPKLVPINSVVEALRAIKESGEIELITHAAVIADAAMAHIRRKIKVGMTELEAAWEIEKFMRDEGSQAIPFELSSPPAPTPPSPTPSPRRGPSGRESR